MRTIAIEMLREHRFIENARGDLRILSPGWVGEIDEEAAVIAIGSGSARARQPLNADQALAVDVYIAAAAKDISRLRELGVLPPLEQPAGMDAATAAAAAAAASKKVN